MIILTFIGLICIAISKAFLDYHSEFTKGKTWKNKWTLDGQNNPVVNDYFTRYNHWWYFKLYRPKYIEKFMFSSTILAFLTDKWHLWQFIMLRFVYLTIAMLLISKIWLIFLHAFVFFPIVVGIVFEPIYYYKKKMLKKKVSQIPLR